MNDYVVRIDCIYIWTSVARAAATCSLHVLLDETSYVTAIRAGFGLVNSPMIDIYLPWACNCICSNWKLVFLFDWEESESVSYIQFARNFGRFTL